MSQVKLDRVLGLTVSSNASLDCDPYSGTVVYPSGCVLVLYNQRRNKQVHIINSLKKPITACKFSTDGKYIVTGEVKYLFNQSIWFLHVILFMSFHFYFFFYSVDISHMFAFGKWPPANKYHHYPDINMASTVWYVLWPVVLLIDYYALLTVVAVE